MLLEPDMPKHLENPKYFISDLLYFLFKKDALILFVTKRAGETGLLVKSTFVCRRSSPRNQNNDLGKSLG